MRSSALPLLLALGTTVHSQLVIAPLRTDNTRHPLAPALPLDSIDIKQHPMDPAGPGPAFPPSQPSHSDPDPVPRPGSVILSDVMGRDRSINIFAGFTRDIESVSRRLDDSGQNTTVLAPLNSAIEKLPRKPWEDPKDYSTFGTQAYEGDDGQERAQRNLQRFVEAHILPESPWPENERVKSIGDDRDIWWHEKDGVRIVRLHRPRNGYDY